MKYRIHHSQGYDDVTGTAEDAAQAAARRTYLGNTDEAVRTLKASKPYAYVYGFSEVSIEPLFLAENL